MVENPVTSGTFDAELSPVVEICALDGGSCDPALGLIETFTTEGSGSTTASSRPAARPRLARACWGDEFLGKLGNGTLNVGQQTSPVAVAGNHQFAAISAGRQHACSLTTDDEAFCWGIATRGRVGDGYVDIHYRATPAAVLGNHRFASISAGGLHTCGVTTADETYCWGEAVLRRALYWACFGSVCQQLPPFGFAEAGPDHGGSGPRGPRGLAGRRAGGPASTSRVRFGVRSDPA